MLKKNLSVLDYMPLCYLFKIKMIFITMNVKKSIITVKESPALSGSLLVEGAKNAALPIIPATLLAQGVSTLYSVPNSQDVHKMIELLECFGAQTSFCSQKGILEINATHLYPTKAPAKLYQSMRASAVIAGPLLARLGEVFLGFPGGDNIGKRPIDLHLEGFKAMGAHVVHHADYIHITLARSKSAEFFLDYPSVGATQNLLLLAASIQEKTILHNIAQEPEVFDLIEVLQKMGAHIEVRSQGMCIIHGTNNLKPFNHAIMPDRLEAGTLLVAAAITKGSIHLANAPAFCMQSLLKKFTAMGHTVTTGAYGVGVTLVATENPLPVSIKTMPYPGFATDLQSPMMALLSVTQGLSTIHETVFESRMNHAYQLNKMGASISVEYDHARINGVKKLVGTFVEAHDIRSCAALVLAGLAAEGTTVIDGVHHLLRGYQGLDLKLHQLGAQVDIVPADNFVMPALNIHESGMVPVST